MTWKVILVRFRVGKRRERFDKRAERDGLGGVVPTGRQECAGASIEEEIGDVSTGEIPFEHKNGGLAKKRLRRRGGILGRKRRSVNTPGRAGCHRESRDEQTCGYSQRDHS